MHVAINTLAVRPKLYGGGVYVKNLVRNLATLDKTNQYTLYVSAPNTTHFEGLGEQFHLLPTCSIPPLRLLWEQTKLPVDLRRRKIDVFHAPGYVSPLAHTCRQVTTINDMTFFLLPEKHTFVKRYYFRALIPLSAERSDVLITASESSRNDIVRILGIRPEKVKVIYLGKDDRFKPMPESDDLVNLRRKYGIGKSVVLSVGVIEPRKNLLTLVEAFAKLKALHNDYILVLAGDYGLDYQRVRRRVQDLRVQDCVVFPGFIPDEELPSLYNLAEVFVYPSLYEGFGLPVLEAMACGIPVITSQVSSMPEIVGNAGLLVDPRSVEELATALARVLTDGELRQRMRKQGLERSQVFSWDRTARETLRVYEELAGS